MGNIILYCYETGKTKAPNNDDVEKSNFVWRMGWDGTGPWSGFKPATIRLIILLCQNRHRFPSQLVEWVRRSSNDIVAFCLFIYQISLPSRTEPNQPKQKAAFWDDLKLVITLPPPRFFFSSFFWNFWLKNNKIIVVSFRFVISKNSA